jgi:hypothetical protein
MEEGKEKITTEENTKRVGNPNNSPLIMRN